MLAKLVNYEMVSPLLPSNETMLQVDRTAFQEMMEKWVESAMVAPYVTPV